MNGFVIVGLIGAAVLAAFLWRRRRTAHRRLLDRPESAILPIALADAYWRHTHQGDVPGGDPGAGGGMGGGDGGGA